MRRRLGVLPRGGGKFAEQAVGGKEGEGLARLGGTRQGGLGVGLGQRRVAGRRA